MRRRAFLRLVPFVLVSLPFVASAFADAGIQVSGPIVHDNLAIYLVHGSGGSGAVPLTGSTVSVPVAVSATWGDTVTSKALVALAGKPTLLVVAAAAYDFTTTDHLARIHAFLCDGTAGVNLALGTWHWGPYPLLSHVDLVNVQGKGFADDNEIAYLERDLGVVVETVL